MMWIDPVVKEVLMIRQALLEQAGGDLHEVIRRAQAARSPGRKVIRGEPRRPVGWTPDLAKAPSTTILP